MTTGLTLRSIASPSFQLPPIVLAATLAITFMAGAAVGPLLSQVGSTSSVAVPALEFDAVQFRWEERQPLSFDEVRFRCEEQERC
jgi:hypothetical protein